MTRRQITNLILRSISFTFGFLAGALFIQAKGPNDPTLLWCIPAILISITAALLEPT